MTTVSFFAQMLACENTKKFANFLLDIPLTVSNNYKHNAKL